MSEIYILKGKFPGFVEGLMGRFQVYGPVLKGESHEFSQIAAAQDVDLSFQNTRMSPKGLFHPQAERMFAFSLAKDDPQAHIVKEVPRDFSPRVVLGIRPCDARAFQADDVNFDAGSIRDPWWVKRRESTTLVGLACNSPCATCFCTSVGTGPFDARGLDVLMVDVGGGYLARAGSDKGKALLDGASEAAQMPADASVRAGELQKKAESVMGREFDTEVIAGKDMMELYHDPLWEQVQFACINCGTCTFMCPTCWCFDIQDEVCGDKGDRLRLWDSCMFPLFTLHGSGHNPRSQKLQRVRQRFMHKLKYYQDKYHNGVACVGCGRCVKACPVNIDIRQVARMMSASCTCSA